MDAGAVLVTAITPPAFAVAGQVARAQAAAHSFEDYRARKSAQILRRHDAALDRAEYVAIRAVLGYSRT